MTFSRRFFSRSQRWHLVGFVRQRRRAGLSESTDHAHCAVRCRRPDGYDSPDCNRRDASFAWAADHYRNVGGADGSIAVGRAARAAPDGYTISIGNVATHVLNGAAYSLSYDLLNDFEAISRLTDAPAFIDAKLALPAKDLKELIAWLKANPNKASAGVFAT